jgi:nucleotidyltransferase/DNA polymerase involved in DNA repair
LRGKPVVTGADRGIVTAASYEAKALGVTRGMPIFRLKKLFPQVIICEGDYPAYVRYSGLMMDIVRRYTDDVEEYSIDECFADLTGLDKTFINGRKITMSYREIAERIKLEIETELDLSVSLGVAPTKCLAKVASKWKKPRGLTFITEADAPTFLAQVPIEKVWGIGGQTSARLKKMGIKTAGDFATRPREWVEAELEKPYRMIWSELNGNSVMELDPNPKTLYSSIQKTRTFHPSTNDKTFLFSQISKHMEDACAKARRYGLIPRTASIFLKTRDFRYATREVKLPYPTNAPEILLSLARREFDIIHTKGILYRTAGVGLHGLTPRKALQSDLFGEGKRAEKFEEVHKRIDTLEEKYGKKLVRLGTTPYEEDEGPEPDRNLLFL